MAIDTFKSAGKTYKISVNRGKSGGGKCPVVVLMHGNFGLGAPYGDQIHDFAGKLAAKGYVTAVPQYYEDDNPHPADTTPHVQTLEDTVALLAGRTDCDVTRLGLIGYSLGAATVMSFVAMHPPGTVKVLADYFGFLTPAIRAGVSKFPPTLIFHNKNDRVVPVQHSIDLDRLLPKSTDHLFVPPYDEHWQELNHAFKPGGAADLDAASKTLDWFDKYLSPAGKS